MIEFDRVTKRYRDAIALDDVSFTVSGGAVTGLLGPNGAGKSTAMRVLLGLDRPTSGRAMVAGARYRDLRHPARVVGASLESRSAHPGRSARAHLTALARFAGIRPGRVDEVLDLVGLTEVASKRVGGFSLGMSQRLGVAAALLGDPGVLVLDEPVNGLDTDGVRWIRSLMGDLADQGRTILLSSHLLSELELVATRVVFLGRGRLLHEGPVSALTQGHTVRVRVADPAGAGRLTEQIGPERVTPVAWDETLLTVVGVSASWVGDVAFDLGIRLHELASVRESLEDAYAAVVRDAADFHAGPREDIA